MRPWNNPRVVSKTPLITPFLLEGGALGQIIRMWHEHTSAGQSLLSWIGVSAALCLWFNFYRVITPYQKAARASAVVGIVLNVGICLTIIYFRYLK